MRMLGYLTPLSVLAVLAGSPANANLVITAAGGSTGDVVQFEQHISAPGFPEIDGDTNKGANTVQFLNLNATATGYGPELLGTSGSGQADVTCVANCISDNKGGANGFQLDGMEIRMVAPIAATTMIFNLDFGEGSVAIVAQDNFGNLFTDTLKNGSNFFRVDAVAGSGEVITVVKIFENAPDPSSGFFGWNDLKQPRILACTENVDCPTQTSVPEPTPVAMLGVGLLGMGMIRLRKRT